jgi:multiple sugar transport system permease protein
MSTIEGDRYVNVDASAARLQKPRRRLNRESATAFLFIAPALVGFLVFFLLPAIRAVGISFTDWNLLSKAKWIGFANYRQLWHDPLFWNAVRVTVGYVLLNIPIQILIGLFLAAVMTRTVKSFAVRGVLILPYLLSNVVAALVWIWIMDPQLGFANQFLHWLHLPTFSYFGSETQSLASVAAINIWRHMGLTAILFYAGMQGIPASTYEAARIDGASEWQMFRRITLPLLRPVTAFVVVTSLVGSFQIFDTIAVATTPNVGGPIDSTRALVVYINQRAFGTFEMGFASSMSVVLFAFLIVFSILQLRLFRGGDSDL